MLTVLACASPHEEVEENVEPIGTILPLPAGQIVWRSWSARDSASVLERPMLLFLYTERSFWCREMVRQCFENADLAREINRGTFPIRIDADMRPDLVERFGMGGFPSTVFLTPQGDWITGGTYLDPEDLQRLLRRVRIYFDIPERREDLERERQILAKRLAKKNRHPSAIVPSLALFKQRLDSTVVVLKKGVWPGEEAVMMVLESGDSAARVLALKVLDRLMESRLRDSDGTFFLAPLSDDWEVLNREKHLAHNAGLLSLFCLTARQTEHVVYRDVARTLGNALVDRFYVSKDTLFAAGWPDFETRSRDGAYYAGWNAMAVSGLVSLYGITKEARYLDIARLVLESLKRRMGHPGGGIRHSPGFQGPLFLEDQALVARAALDLYAVSEQEEHLQLARDLADGIQQQFGLDSGAFQDRYPEPGSPVSPVIDRFLPSGNGVAVQVMIRLPMQDPLAVGRILTSLLRGPLDRSAFAGALNRGLGLYLNHKKAGTP
ncbi:MAG: DUF255 domain-containing protein [bacterium]|nr:DUF255 domain-containing protein [bacterium]